MYAFVFLALLSIGALWLPTVRSVATYFGLLSAGLAIALRDVIQNVAGWLFVIWRRPFVVGERVEIGEFAGDVIDIRVLRITLLEIGNWVDADQTTGRIVHVPSGHALSKPVVNYDRGFRYIWNEIPVFVSQGSDWRRAKEILLGVIEQYASRPTERDEQKLNRSKERYLIVDESLEPHVFTQIVDGDFRLTARYLCDPRRRRQTANDIWEHLIDAVVAEPSVEFAYPTQSIDLSTRRDAPSATGPA